jgi:hypothetical protein
LKQEKWENLHIKIVHSLGIFGPLIKSLRNDGRLFIASVSQKEKLKIQKPQQRSIRVLFTSRSPSMADFKRVQTKKFRRAAEL